MKIIKSIKKKIREKMISKKLKDTKFRCGAIFMVKGQAALLSMVGNGGYLYNDYEGYWYCKETGKSRDSSPIAQCCLIDIRSGNRWTEAIEVADQEEIPYLTVLEMGDGEIVIPIKEHKIVYA